MDKGGAPEPREHPKQKIVMGVQRRIASEAHQLDIGLAHDAKRLADEAALHQQVVITGGAEQRQQPLAAALVTSLNFLVGVDDYGIGTRDRRLEPSEGFGRE